jgi:hypothetical protein
MEISTLKHEKVAEAFISKKLLRFLGGQIQ